MCILCPFYGWGDWDRERLSNCPRWNPGSLSPESILLTASLCCCLTVLKPLAFMYAFLVLLSLSFFLLLSTPCHPSEFSIAIQEILSSRRNYTSLLFSPMEAGAHITISLHCNCNVWAHIFFLCAQPSRGKQCLSYSDCIPSSKQKR